MRLFILSFVFFLGILKLMAQPANNNCAGAITLTPNNSCSYTTATFNGATLSSSAPSCAANASQDVWYKFTATDVTHSISLEATSSLNHGFEIIEGTCGGTVLLCQNANSSSYSEYYINNNFVAGQTYYIRVFNASATLSTASFGVCVQKYPTPSNNTCATAATLTPNTSCSYTTATFSGTTMSTGAPACGANASQDVWYKFTATDVTHSISLEATSSLNHGFEIIEGGCGGTVLQCQNANSSSYSEFYINNNFVVGQTYYIRVFNASATLSTASFGVCVQKYPTPSNNTCATAASLTPNTSCSYTTATFSGTTMSTGAPACGANASQDVWYKFTATDITHSISLEATSSLNHGFEIIEGTCGGTVLQCQNANGSSYSEYYFNNNFVVGQTYYIRVFNANASLTTASFGICVQKYPTPANNICANAVTLTPNNTCSYTTATFSGSTMSTGTPACGANASQDIWYKFTATDITHSISLEATSSLNHGFEIIEGTCGGTMLQCQNANGSSYSEYYFNNNFVAGQTYYIRVFNASATLTTASFGICVQKYPTPANNICVNAVTLTPNNTCSYTTATFSGSTMSTGIPSCATTASQDIWYKFTATDITHSISLEATSGLNHGFELIEGTCGGTVLLCQNANGSSYSEYYFNNNFVVGQTYYIRVFNYSATLTTASFGICVQKYPTPVNNICANAVTLTPNSTCSYTTASFSGSTMSTGTPACATVTSQDIWYKFTATDITHSISLEATSGLNHGFELIEGTCGGTVLLCQNGNGSSYSEYYINNNFVVGQTYYIRVLNTSATLTTASFGICVQKYPTPANNECANALTLSPNTACSYTTASFSGTTLSTGTPACATSASQDVWFMFVATDANMTVTLQATSGLNHGFEIYEASCSGNIIICRNSNGSSYSETYTGSTFVVGQTYYVRAFNTSATLTTANFGICVQGPPPLTCTPTISIATSSGNTSVCAGEQVVFTSTINYGGTTPVYQWKKNGANVGTGMATFTTTALANGDVISCQLTSNEPCANPTQVTSNTLTMTVYAIPSAPVSGSNSPVNEGSMLNLTASTVTGASYAWSGPLSFTSSSQNPTVSNNATLAMGGYYKVKAIANGCSSLYDSTLVVITPATSLEEDLAANTDIIVYPNPVDDVLNIVFSANGISKQILIYDVYGKLVFTGSSTLTHEIINIGTLAKGLYFIEIYMGNEMPVVRRVVKQ